MEAPDELITVSRVEPIGVNTLPPHCQGGLVVISDSQQDTNHKQHTTNLLNGTASTVTPETVNSSSNAIQLDHSNLINFNSKATFNWHSDEICDPLPSTQAFITYFNRGDIQSYFCSLSCLYTLYAYHFRSIKYSVKARNMCSDNLEAVLLEIVLRWRNKEDMTAIALTEKVVQIVQSKEGVEMEGQIVRQSTDGVKKGSNLAAALPPNQTTSKLVNCRMPSHLLSYCYKLKSLISSPSRPSIQQLAKIIDQISLYLPSCPQLTPSMPFPPIQRIFRVINQLIHRLSNQMSVQYKQGSQGGGRLFEVSQREKVEQLSQEDEIQEQFGDQNDYNEEGGKGERKKSFELVKSELDKTISLTDIIPGDQNSAALQSQLIGAKIQLQCQKDQQQLVGIITDGQLISQLAKENETDSQGDDDSDGTFQSSSDDEDQDDDDQDDSDSEEGEFVDSSDDDQNDTLNEKKQWQFKQSINLIDGDGQANSLIKDRLRTHSSIESLTITDTIIKVDDKTLQEENEHENDEENEPKPVHKIVIKKPAMPNGLKTQVKKGNKVQLKDGQNEKDGPKQRPRRFSELDQHTMERVRPVVVSKIVRYDNVASSGYGKWKPNELAHIMAERQQEASKPKLGPILSFKSLTALKSLHVLETGETPYHKILKKNKKRRAQQGVESNVKIKVPNDQSENVEVKGIVKQKKSEKHFRFGVDPVSIRDIHPLTGTNTALCLTTDHHLSDGTDGQNGVSKHLIDSIKKIRRKLNRRSKRLRRLQDMSEVKAEIVNLTVEKFELANVNGSAASGIMAVNMGNNIISIINPSNPDEATLQKISSPNFVTTATQTLSAADRQKGLYLTISYCRGESIYGMRYRTKRVFLDAKGQCQWNEEIRRIKVKKTSGGLKSTELIADEQMSDAGNVKNLVNIRLYIRELTRFRDNLIAQCSFILQNGAIAAPLLTKRGALVGVISLKIFQVDQEIQMENEKKERQARRSRRRIKRSMRAAQLLALEGKTEEINEIELGLQGYVGKDGTPTNQLTKSVKFNKVPSKANLKRHSIRIGEIPGII